MVEQARAFTCGALSALALALLQRCPLTVRSIRTLTVMVRTAPAANVPSCHVRRPCARPAPGTARTKEYPRGSRSRTTTFVAAVVLVFRTRIE